MKKKIPHTVLLIKGTLVFKGHFAAMVVKTLLMFMPELASE